jgi:phosphatidate cytidylyltransferase
MKRLYTALVLIPVTLTLVFLGPRWQWLFTMAVAAVAALAAWEFLGLAEKAGATPPRIAVVLAIVALFASNFEWPLQTAATLGVLSLFLLVYCTFFRSVEQLMADASTSIFCLLYIGFTLISLPALRENPEGNGPSLVTFLLCAVWAGDTAALYAGRAWGRRKMAPTLSPNKTWVGTFASVCGSLLSTGALLGLAQLMQMPMWNIGWRLSYSGDVWWYWLCLAVVVNVAAQVGDLAESALKRSAGVKDSGSLLPGHGGVLDRIDALLIAAPVLWYAQMIH